MTDTPPPDAPQTQSTDPNEPLYSADDLGAAARSFNCYPWDVAGIFAKAGVTMMTIPDFQEALLDWQQPLPVEGA